MAERALEGRVVIVTGAANGIGTGYAKGIAAAGARVVVADLDAAGGERVAREIRDAGGEAHAVAVDIASTDSTLAMAGAARRRARRGDRRHRRSHVPAAARAPRGPRRHLRLPALRRVGVDDRPDPHRRRRPQLPGVSASAAAARRLW
jgi:NAD(P)-dependent dehydrogenase (short-subunit alcohol dehydrogenase family)